MYQFALDAARDDDSRKDAFEEFRAMDRDEIA
jgi:hypothetical protein